MGEYLIYRIHKRLSIVFAKTLNKLGFVVVEDVRDQSDSLVRREGAINQPFPCWNTAAWAIKSGWHRGAFRVKLTDHRKLAARAGVGELPDPNIVVSMPIDRPSNPGVPDVVDGHRL